MPTWRSMNSRAVAVVQSTSNPEESIVNLNQGALSLWLRDSGIKGIPAEEKEEENGVVPEGVEVGVEENKEAPKLEEGWKGLTVLPPNPVLVGCRGAGVVPIGFEEEKVDVLVVPEEKAEVVEVPVGMEEKAEAAEVPVGMEEKAEEVEVP
ncbi:hypothetical protein BT69DRAFT_1297943, partial [Atractiella rhizophila]